MATFRGRSFDQGTVWIPLRSVNDLIDIGEPTRNGYITECLQLGSLAVRLSERQRGDTLGWNDLGVTHWHSSYVRDDGSYSSLDHLDNGFDSFGYRLVIDQYIEGERYAEWHVQPDLVVALGLKRERDTWVSPARDYEEAIRLSRDSEGKPCQIEIRAQYLKDYLCARKMALRISLFRQRMVVLNSRDCVDWPTELVENTQSNNRWEGRIQEIHEGTGMQYGSTMAVFHMGRTEVDETVDVPDFEMGEGVASDSWTKTFDGRKLYRIMGELWKDEWVEPAAQSHIVTGEEPAPTTLFVVNEKGERETGTTLVKGVRWLWFKPEVVPALLQHRGGGLGWYTRFTGHVGCSKLNGVHFGINQLGFVNVFAKDIGQLPEWQQRVWVAFNVGPEGGVSEELLASQNRAAPADTQAPEAFLETAMERLNKASLAKFGYKILQDHAYVDELLPQAHRFRSLNRDGLQSLAKDLARLVVDRIAALEIQKTVPPPKNEKWGGLKSLEKLVATRIGDKGAHDIMGPLHGIYTLRLSDAHLPGGDAEEAMALAKIDTSEPYVHQGLHVLVTCVGTMWLIADIIGSRF